MTISVIGGITFSGGFTFTAEVSSENTAAWFGGGVSPSLFTSTVNRITYATDTATASVRGPLSSTRRNLAAAGNFTDGWFGGGYTNNPGFTNPLVLSTVDRITYATDTATASVRGPLSSSRYYLAAASNTTNAWFGGGKSPFVSTVDRITFATDTATASVRGPLSSVKYSTAAAGNSDYGWFGGGFDPSIGYLTTVDRITYATDTATASVRGPLSSSRYQLAAAGNTTDGWFGAGKSPAGGGGGKSTVQRITYATDTDTASVRGPLSSARYLLAAAGNTTDGWFGGGRTSTSLVDRITYATDTATASVRGPLSSTRYQLAAAGGVQ